MEENEVGYLKVLRWSEEECRAYLERQRWPDGAHCPKCSADKPWKITRKAASKNTVHSLYRCRTCKRQFTATVGTIFEDSKIPLNKWFAGIYLMCSSKKGISAHQLHRTLEITYKSAWFMCHRVREAMGESYDAPLSGTIEADETYVGGSCGAVHKLTWERKRMKRTWAWGHECTISFVRRKSYSAYWSVGEASEHSTSATP